jgi:ankyrin repeat protein
MYGNALQQAAARGNVQIFKWLLEQGAEFNAEGCVSYGSALQAAICGGNYEVFQLLLGRGADVNALGRWNGNLI